MSNSQFGAITEDANNIAEAANSTIQTLQQMIDEKNREIMQLRMVNEETKIMK